MEESSQVRLWDWSYKYTVLGPLADITQRYYALDEAGRSAAFTKFLNEIANWGHKHLRNRWTRDDEVNGNAPERIIFAHAFSNQTLVRVSALVDVRIENPGGELLLVLKHLMYLNLEKGTPELHPSIKYALDRANDVWLPLYFPNYDETEGVRGHPQIHSVTAYSNAYKNVEVHQSQDEFPRVNVRADTFTFERYWVGNSDVHTEATLGNQKVAERYSSTLQKWKTFEDVVKIFSVMEMGATNTKAKLTSLWRGRSFDLMAYGHSNVAVWGSVFIAQDETLDANADIPYRLVVNDVYATSMPMGWDLVKTATDRDPFERQNMTEQRLASMVPVDDILQMKMGTIEPNSIRKKTTPPPKTSVSVYFDPLFEDGLPFYYYRKYKLTDEDVVAMIESELDERKHHMFLMLRVKAWINATLLTYIKKVVSDENQQKEFHDATIKYLTGAAKVWFTSDPVVNFVRSLVITPEWVYGLPRLVGPKQTAPVNFVAGIYEKFVRDVFPKISEVLERYNQMTYQETDENRATAEESEASGDQRPVDPAEQARLDEEAEQRTPQRASDAARKEKEEEALRLFEAEAVPPATTVSKDDDDPFGVAVTTSADPSKLFPTTRPADPSRPLPDVPPAGPFRPLPDVPPAGPFRPLPSDPSRTVSKTPETPETAETPLLTPVQSDVVFEDMQARMGGFAAENWFAMPDRITDGTIDEIRGAVDAGIRRRGIAEQRIGDGPGGVGVILVGLAVLGSVEAPDTATKENTRRMVPTGGIWMDPGCQRQVLGVVEGPPPTFVGMAFPSAYRRKRRRGVWHEPLEGGDIMIKVEEEVVFIVSFLEVDLGVTSSQAVAEWVRTSRAHKADEIDGVTQKMTLTAFRTHISKDGNVVGWLTTPNKALDGTEIPRDLISGIIGGNIIGTDASQFRLNHFFLDTQRAASIDQNLLVN